MEENYDVFISYSDRTPQAAEAVADALQEAGISVWMARRNLEGGETFSGRIMKMIHGCKVFLLVLDEESMDSEYVLSEVSEAFKRKRDKELMEFIVFHVDGSDISSHLEMAFYINHYQWMEAHPPDKGIIEKLKERIVDILGDTYQAPHSWNLTPMILHKGSCGDSVTYTLDSDGILSISGTGTMWDFWDSSNSRLALPWQKQRDYIHYVYIQDGVTSVGKLAFSDCTKLVGVEIAGSVTDIRAWAFQNCTALQGIVIPEGVREIRGYAFQGCVSLSHASIPQGAHISNCAFPPSAIIMRR